MTVNDFKELLKNSDDKLEPFSSKEKLRNCNFEVNELISVIEEFLNDEEKAKLFEFNHFLNLPTNIKFQIIRRINSAEVKNEIFSNEAVMKDFSPTQVQIIIKDSNDDFKSKFLRDSQLLEKYNLGRYDIKDLINSMNSEKREELFKDVDLIKNNLKLSKYDIAKTISEFGDEKSKLELADKYELDVSEKISIFKTFDDASKTNMILNRNSFRAYQITDLLSSYSPDNLIKFFSEHSDLLKELDVSPYKITSQLTPENQLKIFEQLEQTSLSLNDKRKIVNKFDQSIKDKLKQENCKDEYKGALSVTIHSDTSKLDLDQDLKNYEGLDELLFVTPENLDESKKQLFLQLCDICPKMIVNCKDFGQGFASSASEYKRSEFWIDELIKSIPEEYNDAQKLALIDNAIGKKISYSPDFDTEVSNPADCRALWKVIDSGYGVCNGIANVEKYILNRVGIKSEIISTNSHAFLKINDIELPLATGETKRGNTIVDPTWNLTAHRFNGYPNNFCLSYDEIRENDIDENGTDQMCHKNDEQLSDATLSLDENSLRNLFTSVGLADKDGQFKFKTMIQESEHIHEMYKGSPNEDIAAQLKLIKDTCPDFAKCPNSTMSVLSSYSLDNENLSLNKCVVSRVYTKNDQDKKPVMYIYVDIKEAQKFFIADRDSTDFTETTVDEFTKNFECYSYDLEKNNGIRPGNPKKNLYKK